MAMFILFVLIAAGFDFLRGFGIVQTPRYADFMSIYRPESYWYLARGIISTLLLLVFEVAERTVVAYLSTLFSGRQHMASDSIPSERSGTHQ
ncbi:hypothetical protein PAN31108_01701 [Pandoraea anhela]|uniref:Uncharacterized protein n=2 Tax=Pandoraea anhela TaxID=2508295 RepID=A0A5E4TXV5_9BURK|nr:hypothetical protein PAN31108_01701 [Pandoraea anhela]